MIHRSTEAAFVVALALVAGCGGEVRRVVDPATDRVLEEASWSGVELHGEFRSWYVDGTPRAAGRWEHGVPVGVHTTWHATGRKEQEGAWVDGVRDGSWPRWYENGMLEWSGSWAAGDKDGTWTRFDEAGTVLETEQWDHGTRVAHTRAGESG